MFKRRKHCCRNVYIIGNAIFDGLEEDETEDGDVEGEEKEEMGWGRELVSEGLRC